MRPTAVPLESLKANRIAILALAILSIPCVGWPFLWDDFGFLSRAASFQVHDLLPSPGEALYRPVSREIWFAVLERTIGTRPLVAHLLNFAIAVCCLCLVERLATRLAGKRAGLLAAMLFASSAWLPFLVGWASGVQDLLCLLFALAALHFALSERFLLSGCSMMLAVFSKETALALLPTLPMLSWVQSRSVRRSAVAAGVVLVVWLVIHPWPRSVLAGTSSSGYAAYQGMGAARNAASTALASFNLVVSKHEWRADVLSVGLVAILLLLIGIRTIHALKARPPGAATTKVTAVGLVWFAGPILLTSMLLRLQFPYYGFIPMVGLSLVGAALLANAPRAVIASTLLAFLALGIGGRQAYLGQDRLAEQNFHVTAPAMRRVEETMRGVLPTLPPAARVFVYVQSPGRHGVYTALYSGQPLRVWYHDPDVRVLDPLKDRPRATDENLAWVSYDLSVYGVDTATLRPRGEGKQARFDEYQKTLRAYAMGIAGSGDVDRAVKILTTMPQYAEHLKAYDRRTAAAILLSVGRRQEADSLLRGTPHFRRDEAIQEVAGLVAKPVPGLDLDTASMKAFELPANDFEAVQAIRAILIQRGFPESAARIGSRVRPSNPG